MPITPSSKDLVLAELCTAEFEVNVYIPLRPFLQHTHLEFHELQAVLNQFERLGFISNLNLRRTVSDFFLIVHLDALDFKNRGGFLVQEEVLKLTLEKLYLEVEQLSKDFPEKALTFTGIAANIATCLGLITGLSK